MKSGELLDSNPTARFSGNQEGGHLYGVCVCVCVCVWESCTVSIVAERDEDEHAFCRASKKGERSILPSDRGRALEILAPPFLPLPLAARRRFVQWRSSPPSVSPEVHSLSEFDTDPGSGSERWVEGTVESAIRARNAQDDRTPRVFLSCLARWCLT